MEVPEAEPRAIGITMGTYQVAGCLMEHSSANLYFDKGHVELPCYVAFTDTECLLGRRAMDQMVDNPENTIYDIKRLLGRFYDDPEIQDYLKEWPFTVIDDHNRPKYQVRYKGQVTTFYPEEIIALFFKAIKEHAEHHLYMPVTEAVITVPAQFNILQRQSTVDASLMAGLTVLQIINETTAAAIVYGFLRPHIENEGDKNIAMISVGCGFLDVSLITYDDRVFECKSTRGTCRLDINRSMIHYFADKILDKHGVDVFKDKAAYLRLWKACELAKCKLKLERECTIVVPWINPVSDFEDKFTRDQFNEILGELKETLRTLLYKCLSDAGWSADSLHECLMVGGSSEIHCLENAFRDLGTLTRSCQVLDYPHLHAVVGAAMRATSLKGGHQMGLADLITLEIAPRTFGVMTREGKCRSLVKHNESIPQWSSEDYTTYADNQAFIHIEVYDGESRIASENKLMGRYCVTDFPLRKRGKTHIRVTFHVDLCGLLVIWAEDKSPDALETPITVRNETGLILREELQAVTQLFHNTFPPEPVPRWTVAEQEQLAVANQQNPVDADVQPGNVQQAEADNAQPQNGAPVLNGHPEGDGNPGLAGNGEAGDGGGCVPIVMNSNL